MCFAVQLISSHEGVGYLRRGNPDTGVADLGSKQFLTVLASSLGVSKARWCWLHVLRAKIMPLYETWRKINLLVNSNITEVPV